MATIYGEPPLIQGAIYMEPQVGDPPSAQGLVNPQLVSAGRPSASPPRRGRWLLWLLALGVLAVMFLLCLTPLAGLGNLSSGEPRLSEKRVSGPWMARHKVAVITIEGAIMDGEGYPRRQIDQDREDDQVKWIVLRVVSPGGSVSASDYIYHHLRQLREDREIPLVVSMGSLAASGGYYVSMAAGDQKDVIFAEPTTFTGSIGVIIPHFNVAGLMEEWKVESDSIVSHPLKEAGTLTKKLNDQERAIFQALVDDGFSRFKQVVRYGRPALAADEAALDAIATGQVFTAKQALENGLVDREGFVEDAIDRAIELANLDQEQVRVIEYQPQHGIFEEVFLGGRVRSPTFDVAALIDLTTPRAYYLCTWLPALAGLPRPR